MPSRSWIALILAAPAALHAQQDSATARLAGTVRSSVNGRPIPGVMVAVAGTRAFDVTDSTGAFALSGLPAGRQTIRILYRDDVAAERVFRLTGRRTLQLDVLLDVEAVQLAPVVVEVSSARASSSLAGFYERRKRSFGRFYTFEDLETRGALPVAALLAESGIQVRCRLGRCVPLVAGAGRLCVPAVYFDGLPVPAEELDSYRADELAGMEVYRSGFDVPWEFQRRFGFDCGAVAMWGRY